MELVPVRPPESSGPAPVIPDSPASLRVPAVRSSGASESASRFASDPDFRTHVRVGVVGEHPGRLTPLQQALSAAGYAQVLTVSPEFSSERAAEQLDLLLVDLVTSNTERGSVESRFPTADGVAPWIAIVAPHDSTTRLAALRAGCADCLPDPLPMDDFDWRARAAVERWSRWSELSSRASALAAETARQAEQLATVQHEAQLRYLVGKAEIATDVLHNVGNALNSVNVGVNLVAYTIRDSKIRSLKRAVDLMREQGDNLARFLTRDERGRLLPSYLYTVTESLLAERDKVAAELELLRKHVEHINAVVATQQKYARVCHVAEDVSLVELLTDVEGLLCGSLAKLGIEVVRSYDDMPTVRTDRQCLLQVLLNVVKNAIESLKQAHKSGQGRLELRVYCRDEQRAVIQVTDNGVGIPPENLVRVFSHGFTTKKEGHGFGLHSCGNLMKELGGSISVHSQGLGHGARFTLEIPVGREEK